MLHAESVVGKNVIIAQRVTLGGRSGLPGAPVIEDDVFLGAGAAILGPIRVGRGAVVGANAVVIKDVPPGASVGGVPARILRASPSGETPATE